LFVLGKKKNKVEGFSISIQIIIIIIIIIIIKEEKALEVTILLAKPFCPSNQSIHGPI
jgi:hypothetical protein